MLVPNRPLLNIGIRYLLRHPWQTALMVLGIALGVAVIVAIDLANSAASRAFDLSTDALAGRATHQVVDGASGLDDAVYARLRTELNDVKAAPVVTAYITSPQLGSRPIQLFGVDPFAEAPFRSYLVADASTENSAAGARMSDGRQGPGQPLPSRLRRELAGSGGASVDVNQPSGEWMIPFLTRPGALLISEELAAEYGLTPGAEITLDAGGRITTAFVAGLLRPADRLSRRALEGLILADIATAQEITGRPGKLSYIDLILPEGSADVASSHLASFLPPAAQIVPVGGRTGILSQMTAAFRTNLTALSLLALVVGMFLIYNSMTFSVVQRRSLFGALRCLGATREEIGRMVLAEAAAVGALGSLLGLVLGVLLGQGAVRLVTQTINDLYFVVTVRGIVIPADSLLKGAAVGLLATVASAAFPAREAASVSPKLALQRSSIEETARQAVPLTAWAGAIALAVGAGLLAVPPQLPLALLQQTQAGTGSGLLLGFAGIFFVTIGFALLAPATTLALMRVCAPVTSRLFGALGRMAPRSVTAALSRTAIAIAALMVAVSVTIGVGLMVGSFRSSVITWLGQTLWGDVYLSAPALTAVRSSTPLDPAVLQIVQGWPSVARTDVLRSVDVVSPAGPIAVAAVSDKDFTVPRIFVSTEGGRPAAAEAVRQGAVLASEPLANRLGLPSRGATVTLYTDRGPHAFPVAGIYRDYSSSQGAVMMSLDLYRSYWNDEQITSIALKLRPGADADVVVKELEAQLSGVQGVLVRPNRALRAEALAVFDRAFAITNALQLLAALVAFIGVLSALLSLQLDRAREIGILRAVGLTVQQLAGLVLLETGLMGAVAGLLAMPTGLTLAVILIYIINRRSFGWTLQLQADPRLFLQALALAVIAALLAGVYPALRMGRMAAAEALRGE